MQQLTYGKSFEAALYIHIPFCRHMCLYCDFAKTARWQSTEVNSYFTGLRQQYGLWKNYFQQLGVKPLWKTVNFGGGTPSLFIDHLCQFLAFVGPDCQADAEISLEANPLDITEPHTTQALRQSGFNRISIGVQSFDPQGLKTLTRDHSPTTSHQAITHALQSFPHVGIDLIYCWPQQSLLQWEQDLQTALSYPLQHLSCYNMTYAEGTPFGRMVRRGALTPHVPDREAEYYNLARKYLQGNNWQQEEVSNWSQEGYACKHNLCYWQMEPYLGLGTGAHGFLTNIASLPQEGIRYAYHSRIHKFCTHQHLPPQTNPSLIWDRRERSHWMLEYLGSGLRTAQGICFEKVTAMGFTFKPTPFLEQARTRGDIHWNSKYLQLKPQEWFRETSWAVECSRAFQDSSE